MRQLRCSFLSLFLLATLLVVIAAATSRQVLPPKAPDGPLGIMVMDGSPVHDVGELKLHMSNWGGFGSWPGSQLPFSSAPSGEWPAGSGIEHVFTGGLWVAALKSGVPAVSTAAYQWEFRPTQSIVDIVYESAQGAPGGVRFPFPGSDDDNDGVSDEDFLDGYDNDLDGLVDEDFAAISDQMLSRWHNDQEPSAVQAYPEHNPLNILVREQSYQWEHDDFDDFVGIDYEITNTGSTVLEDVYIGIFYDGDVGDRDTPNYFENDVSGFRRAITCTEFGAVRLDYGYIGDPVIGSGMGVLLLDHPTDPNGAWAPTMVQWSTFAAFSGAQPFEDGGDPTNDFQRYEVMSGQTIERDAVTPRDQRILLSAGPFSELAPGATIKFSVALVAFPIADQSNVISAAVAYRGRWLNADDDPNTGVEGRETPVEGPAEIVIDACRTGYDQPITIGRVTEWINLDCHQEDDYQSLCGYNDPELFVTGVNGKEYQAHWILPDEEIPTPVAIQRFDARRNGSAIVLEWEIWADEVINGYTLLRSTGSRSLTVLADNIPSTQHGFVDAGVKPGAHYEYQLIARGESGWTAQSQRVGVTMPAAELLLRTVSPNPFTSDTAVSFTLPARATVDIVVYDVTGRRVATVFAGEKDPGDHTVRWNGMGDDGDRVGAGVYFCRIQAGKESRIRKMVVMR